MSVERLKAEMTVSKALSLITNKYSVSAVDLKVACSASSAPPFFELNLVSCAPNSAVRDGREAREGSE